MKAATALFLILSTGAFYQAQTPPAQTPPAQPPPAPAPAPAGGVQSPAGRGGQGTGQRQNNPVAGQRPPATAVAQTYSAEQVQTGRAIFTSQCAFCHGRDAMGGETGPDLTRSQVVAEDVRGDKIVAMIRGGKPEKGMPPFPQLSESDVAAVVAFVHDAKVKAESFEGNRRTVEVTDLQTGDAKAGEAYFNGPGGCATCHSATGDLAGIATRIQGLTLLQRMLYPSGRGGKPGVQPYAATVTVTPATGAPVTGRLAYRDDFVIALTDATGAYRSWSTARVKYSIEDKLEAHVAQLPKYSDKDMHDVLAYLHTLK